MIPKMGKMCFTLKKHKVEEGVFFVCQPLLLLFIVYNVAFKKLEKTGGILQIFIMKMFLTLTF